MIKAIETKYKGYRFRSRLEARWAVFFDVLGIEWRYEDEGYILDDGTKYLPDFWLPNEKVWVEIKGDTISENDLKKCELFAKDKQKEGRFRILVGGIPGINELRKISGSDLLMIPAFSYQWECEQFPEFAYFFNVFPGIEKGTRFIPTGWVPTNAKRIPRALKAARSARFEFGESP